MGFRDASPPCRKREGTLFFPGGASKSPGHQQDPSSSRGGSRAHPGGTRDRTFSSRAATVTLGADGTAACPCSAHRASLAGNSLPFQGIPSRCSHSQPSWAGLVGSEGARAGRLSEPSMAPTQPPSGPVLSECLGSSASSASDFLLVHLLGGHRGWLLELSSCHPFERPGWKFWITGSGLVPAVADIWKRN